MSECLGGVGHGSFVFKLQHLRCICLVTKASAHNLGQDFFSQICFEINLLNQQRGFTSVVTDALWQS